MAVSGDFPRLVRYLHTIWEPGRDHAVKFLREQNIDSQLPVFLGQMPLIEKQAEQPKQSLSGGLVVDLLLEGDMILNSAPDFQAINTSIFERLADKRNGEKLEKQIGREIT